MVTVSSMNAFDPDKAITELQQRLGSGARLGDALRSMFHDDGYGLVELCRAVSRNQGISIQESMRIVVHETQSWGGRRGAAAKMPVNQQVK